MTPDTLELLNQLERLQAQLNLLFDSFPHYPNESRMVVCSYIAKNIDKQLTDIRRIIVASS